MSLTKKKEVTLPKNFWKKKLKIEEFALIPKLPVDNLTLKEQYTYYIVRKDYFSLKKRIQNKIKKKEEPTKKDKDYFRNLCENHKLPNVFNF
jgi:hypothetical protein